MRKTINTQKKHTEIVSKSDKSTFKTKKENIMDYNRKNDKNNDWKLLGKPYSQFVFVSVSKLFTMFIL